MTPEELLLKEAVEAREKGDLALARDLYSRLLKIDRSNPFYWLQLSTVVESKKERSYCLKEVLKLDSANLIAIRGLRLLGEDYEDPGPDLDISLALNNWKTSLDVEPPKKVTLLSQRKLIGFVFLGLFVLFLIAGGIFLALQPRYFRDNSPIVRFTITPSPTVTPVVLQLTPTPQDINAISVILASTFTPTPVYVATPHNLTEAYSAGMKAFQDQEWSKAADYFNQVLIVEPNSADVYYLLGEAYRFQGLYGEASRSYDSAISANADFGPAYMGKGNIYLQSDPPKLEEAHAAFEKASQLDSNLDEALLALANISLDLDDATSAQTWLQKISAQNANTPLVEYARARTYFSLGDYRNALASVAKSNSMDPSYLPLYKLWAQVLLADGQFENAIPVLQVYRQNVPSDPDTNLLLANASMSIGDYEKALEAVNAAIENGEKSEEAYILRGDIYMIRGELELAEADYNAALRLNYYSFGATIGKGRTQLAVTYAGSAYNYFLRAADYAETESENAVALFWRAAALTSLEEYNAAARDFEALLALPLEIVPVSLRATAVVEYKSIITATPSLTPTTTGTVTKTPDLSETPAASLTKTIKASITPTR